MTEPPTVALEPLGLSPDESMRRAAELEALFARRRSVRDFSSEPLPDGVLEACLRIAASAPSGANKQPWTWVVVRDAATKARIRAAAEREERAFYEGRAPERWLEDLAPLGTDADKPFLERAPALVVLFARRYGKDAADKHYYVSESVGIAAGLFIAALHQVGLATLPHTPSPMGFLSEILGRPPNERAFLLLPVGYPAPGCRVPAIVRKPESEVIVVHRAEPG